MSLAMTRGENGREGSHALVRRLLLRVLGRPVVCGECGQPIFTGFAYIVRGRVRVVGADKQLVRVAFADQNTLRFTHGELDACPAPTRPWVNRDSARAPRG